MDSKFNDTVEISIPFVKLGIKLSENKIFGIAFDVTDTQTFWAMYPESCSKDNPSTWAVCEIIEDANTVTDNKIQKNSIFPNPASEYIEVCRDDFSRAANEIFIYNSFSECVKKVDSTLSTPVQRIDVSQLQVGIYYLQIGNFFKKFAVVR